MEFDKALQGLKQTNSANADKASHEVETTKRELADLRMQEVFVKSIQSLAKFIEGHTTKTVVMNQLKDYATSDDMESIGKVLIDVLKELKTHENTDVSPVVGALNEAVSELKLLPKEQLDIRFPEQRDYSQSFKELLQATKEVMGAIKAQKLTAEAPIVTYEAPDIHVDAPDLKPLGKDIKDAFLKAVKAIVIPEPKDYSKVLSEQLAEQKKTNKLLEEIPTGGGASGSSSIAPFLDDNGRLPVATGAANDPKDYYTYNQEEGTTSYYGKTHFSTGAWMITKLTDALVSYATVTNNGSVTTYTDAWTDRAVLTYGRIDEAF